MAQTDFSGHPFLTLLEKLPEAYPYLRKSVVVFHHQSTDRIEAYVQEADEKITEAIDISSVRKILQNLRSEKANYEWHQEAGLPFKEDNGPAAHDISLFTENQMLVLLLRFKSPSDGRQDLVFLHFDPQGIRMTFKYDEIDTRVKAWLAPIAYHQIKAMLSLCRIFETENKKLKSTARKVIANIRQTDSSEDFFREKQKNYIQEILEDLSSQQKFKLTDEGMQKILKAGLKLSEMRQVLKQAIETVEFLEEGRDGILPEWSLILPQTENPDHPEQEEIVESRYIRSYQLLEKLEDAAQKVKQEQNRLTGGNVGKAFSTPISAPAITDALKKHGTRIISLMERFPDRWTVIRREFRPVQNLLSKRAD